MNFKTGIRFLRAAFVIGFFSILLLEALIRISGLGARFFSAMPGRAAGGKHVILCAGDSFVYGIGGLSFPAQLEQILNERSGGENYKVYNTGVAGSNSAMAVARLQKEMRDFKPETLIFLAGASNFWNTMSFSERRGWREKADGFLMHSAAYRFFKQVGIKMLSSRRAPYKPLEGPSAGRLAVSSVTVPVPDIERDPEAARQSAEIVPEASQKYASGNISGGMELYRKALEKDPSCQFCYQALLSHCLSINDKDNLRKYLYLAFRVKENSFSPFALAGFSAVLGDNEHAVWFYNKAFETSDHPEESCREMIRIQTEGGDWKSAESSVNRCLAKEVSPDPVYTAFLMALGPQKNQNETIAFAEHELYDRKRSSPMLYHALLMAMNARNAGPDGTYELREMVVQTGEKAIALYPDSYDLYMDILDALTALRKFPEMDKYLASAIRLAGGDKKRLAEIYRVEFFARLHSDNYKTALIAADNYAASVGKCAQSEYMKGYAYFSIQKDAEAERHLKESVLLAHLPSEKELPYSLLGQIYLLNGRHLEAQQMYGKVIAINPKNIDAYNNMFVASSNIGDYEDIVKVLLSSEDYNVGNEKLSDLLEQALGQLDSKSLSRLAAAFPRLQGRPAFVLARKQALLKKDSKSLVKNTRSAVHQPVYYRERKITEEMLKRKVGSDNDAIESDYEQVYYISREYGVRLILSSYPEKEFSRVRRVASRHSVTYVDMKDIFERKFKSRSEWVSYDNDHCNTAGYRAMAEAYADVILPSKGK